jgi:hypothetical protein
MPISFSTPSETGRPPSPSFAAAPPIGEIDGDPCPASPRPVRPRIWREITDIRDFIGYGANPPDLQWPGGRFAAQRNNLKQAQVERIRFLLAKSRFARKASHIDLDSFPTLSVHASK